MGNPPDERFLAYDTLANLIKIVQDMTFGTQDGTYDLWAPAGFTELRPDMKCAILLLYTDDDDDFVPEFARKHNLEVAYIGQDMQHVIEVALGDKPQASPEELIKALNYYADNDAFLDLYNSG